MRAKETNNQERQKDVESIFHAVLQRRSPSERAAYLDGACEGDVQLHTKVEALLQAHDEAGDFLVDETKERPTERLGANIGRYKILQVIGEGGFGTVYMAEQQEPVRRKIALKIIKLGMDTKQVIARFEAERQALALMNHQNIAKVFDAGSTESGRPYFVMELVRGVSITEYCDRNNLNSQSRLALFLDVCSAVQHAHQKGIIHRDIKPSNVMVTMHDGRPVPKIIDFGVSKATHQRLTEKTLFTEYHQFIGTPQYMSPEQAEMSGLDIDTRSDLYSLGALLYELLTGVPPFEKGRLREAGYAEIQRIICNEDPPKPSTRVVTLIQQDTTVADHHGVPPQAFSRLLRGELDCIVMKAMDKDRTRRYDSASELAADILRYLNYEPVVAAPPGLRYNVTKFVRRHRWGVLAGCMTAASLILGCALAITGFVQARHDRDIANREVERTQVIANYLHDALVVSDPDQELALVGDLKQTVNRAYEVFGDDPATVAAVLNSLSLQLQAAGNYGAAEELLHESISIWKRSEGPLDSNVGIALSRLGKLALKGDEAAAERAYRESIAICEKQKIKSSPYLATALAGLAEVLQGQSNYQEAENSLRRALAIRREVAPHQKLEIALTLNRLTNVLSLSGNVAELEPALDELLVAFREAMPTNKNVIAKILTQTAAFYIDQKDHEKAEQHLREALETYRTDPNASQFYREVALRYLSIVINELDDDSIEYVAKRREYLNLVRETIGEDHPRIGLLLSDYSRYMVDHDEPIEAIELAMGALGKLDKTVGLETYAKGALVAMETAVQTVALDPQCSENDYQTALAGSKVLVERQPTATQGVVIRGALEYRLGQYSKSLTTLTELDSESERPAEEILLVQGFTAMAHHQLGHSEQAQDQLEEIQERSNLPESSEIEFRSQLLTEVEQVLADSTPKQEPVASVTQDK